MDCDDFQLSKLIFFLNTSSLLRMTSLFQYPDSNRHDDQFEEIDFHGTKILEKYKWLEDPHSEEVQVCIQWFLLFDKQLTF